MKRSDVILIVLIASVTIVVAFFATRAIFGGAPNEPVTVQTIEKITTDISEPDPAIFNANAINPTCNVSVGVSTNSCQPTGQ